MFKRKDKPKVFWSYIKSKSKTRDKVCDLMQDDGSLTVNNSEKSNRKAMNRNWSNQKANPALKIKAGNK